MDEITLKVDVLKELVAKLIDYYVDSALTEFYEVDELTAQERFDLEHLVRQEFLRLNAHFDETPKMFITALVTILEDDSIACQGCGNLRGFVSNTVEELVAKRAKYYLVDTTITIPTTICVKADSELDALEYVENMGSYSLSEYIEAGSCEVADVQIMEELCDKPTAYYVEDATE